MKFRSKDYLFICEETRDVQSVINFISGLTGFALDRKIKGWPNPSFKTKKDLESLFSYISMSDRERELVRGNLAYKRLFKK